MALLTLRPTLSALADDSDLTYERIATAGEVRIYELNDVTAAIASVTRVRVAVRSLMETDSAWADIGLDLGGARLMTTQVLVLPHEPPARYDGAWHATRPGGGAWTKADLNALRAAVSSGTSPTYTHRVHEVYVEVDYVPNTAPSAPGAFTSPTAGAVVDTTGTVAAGASTDPDGDSLTYEWSLSLDNGGSYSAPKRSAAGTSWTYDYTNEAATTAARWRVRAWDGAAWSLYTTSDAFTIQHNQAPTAPTPTYPVSNTAIDRDAANRFTATFNDPDSGDVPSAHDVRYRLVGATTWTTVSAANSNAFHDFTAATFAAGNYEYQWRYYDRLGVASPWSASAFFTAGTRPAAPTGLDPINGSTVGASTGVLSWAANAQDAYEVRKVADNAGSPDTATVYSTSGVVESASARNHGLTYPVNGRAEHLQVRVRSAGLWSDWASVRITVDYTAPATPAVVLLVTLAGTIEVSIANPAPTGTQPVVQSVDIWRRRLGDLGVGIRRAAAIAPVGPWTDHAVVNRTGYEFRATAHGANGTSTDGPWTSAAAVQSPTGSESLVAAGDELIVT